MLLDAIVLAGGRSSRLGGEPKQHLIVDGRSLLQRTLGAAREAGAQRIVVVGEPSLAAALTGAGLGADRGVGVETGAEKGAETGVGLETGASAELGAGSGTGVGVGLETGTGAESGARSQTGARVVAEPGTGVGSDRAPRVEVVLVREEPPFGGPAAAIAAGVRALAPSTADGAGRRILVLASDMPGCREAVLALMRVAETTAADAAMAEATAVDGFVAVDASGRRQHLLGLYDVDALAGAVQRVRSRLDGLAVRTLVQPLQLREVTIPVGAADDVDTWDDAERLGARPPSLRTKEF